MLILNGWNYGPLVQRPLVLPPVSESIVILVNSYNSIPKPTHAFDKKLKS